MKYFLLVIVMISALVLFGIFAPAWLASIYLPGVTVAFYGIGLTMHLRDKNVESVIVRAERELDNRHEISTKRAIEPKDGWHAPPRPADRQAQQKILESPWADRHTKRMFMTGGYTWEQKREHHDECWACQELVTMEQPEPERQAPTSMNMSGTYAVLPPMGMPNPFDVDAMRAADMPARIEHKSTVFFGDFTPEEIESHQDVCQLCDGVPRAQHTWLNFDGDESLWTFEGGTPRPIPFTTDQLKFMESISASEEAEMQLLKNVMGVPRDFLVVQPEAADHAHGTKPAYRNGCRCEQCVGRMVKPGGLINVPNKPPTASERKAFEDGLKFSIKKRNVPNLYAAPAEPEPTMPEVLVRPFEAMTKCPQGHLGVHTFTLTEREGVLARMCSTEDCGIIWMEKSE